MYFRKQNKIDFLDAKDLKKILFSHSVDPCEPGEMCVTTSSLVYFDSSKCEIHRLDLNELQNSDSLIRIKPATVYDLCFAQYEGKELLVLAAGDEGVYAYNIETNQIEWEIDAKLPGMKKKMQATGITADGRGRLFVADWKEGNKCIQMFSVSDGQYLGHLMKDEEVLGAPGKINWCKKTSSLLSAYYLFEKWYFKVINFRF